MGGGDCDNDSECADGLVCGTKNCRDFYSNADVKADCCTNATTTITGKV